MYTHLYHFILSPGVSYKGSQGYSDGESNVIPQKMDSLDLYPNLIK